MRNDRFNYPKNVKIFGLYNRIGPTWAGPKQLGSKLIKISIIQYIKYINGTINKVQMHLNYLSYKTQKNAQLCNEIENKMHNYAFKYKNNT